MNERKLEHGVRRVLTSQLDSFEKLEIVRALRATGPAMSTNALEAACRLPSHAVREALADLARNAIIERVDAERLVVLGAGSKHPHLEALMQLYEDDRSGVMAVLSSLAMERIRAMAARAFADAFVIRRVRSDSDAEALSWARTVTIRGCISVTSRI